MSWYALKSQAVPTRYGLSRIMQELLQGLEDYHQGMIDDMELGRLVCLSPNKRAAVANTITKCAGIIKKEPDEMKNCLAIIEMCTAILEFADRPPPPEAFPFMRLPVEIRDKIMSLIINNIFHSKGIVAATKSACRCPNYDRAFIWQSEQMKDLPSMLGPTLCFEFFRILFRKKKFRFRCSCELYSHLTRNEHLLNNVEHVAVHWCGPNSVKAFKMLAKCPRLERLTILISKSTLANLSPRACLMRSYFPLHYRTPRMSDILGLDEILEIRGLEWIEVTKARSIGGGSSMANEMDMAHLCDLLTDILTQPRAT